jgi:pimeloyl-ACP methyl ester carboxylesterase
MWENPMLCPSCQTENPDHAKLCMECGHRFVAPATRPAQVAKTLPADARPSTAAPAGVNPALVPQGRKSPDHRRFRRAFFAALIAAPLIVLCAGLALYFALRPQPKSNEQGAATPAPRVATARPHVLDLPPGIEAKATIATEGDQVKAARDAEGPVVQFEGHASLFDAPVTLSLPLFETPSESRRQRLAAAYWTGESWFCVAAPLEFADDGGPVARVKTRHFSFWTVLARTAGYGLELPEGAASARRVVVFVHGLDSGPDTWKPMLNALEPSRGKDTAFALMRYPNDQGIKKSGDLFGEELDKLARRNPDAQIDIVAHSMGGLVARYVLEQRGTRAKVNNLIMLGTPNHGSALARGQVVTDLLDKLNKAKAALESDSAREGAIHALFIVFDGAGQAAIDLEPGSAFLRMMNPQGWHPPSSVKYINIVGTRPPAALSDLARVVPLPSEVTLGSGDGVVNIFSAFLPDIDEYTIPANHGNIHQLTHGLAIVSEITGLSLARMRALVLSHFLGPNDYHLWSPSHERVLSTMVRYSKLDSDGLPGWSKGEGEHDSRNPIEVQLDYRATISEVAKAIEWTRMAHLWRLLCFFTQERMNVDEVWRIGGLNMRAFDAAAFPDRYIELERDSGLSAADRVPPDELGLAWNINVSGQVETIISMEAHFRQIVHGVSPSIAELLPRLGADAVLRLDDSPQWGLSRRKLVEEMGARLATPGTNIEAVVFSLPFNLAKTETRSNPNSVSHPMVPAAYFILSIEAFNVVNRTRMAAGKPPLILRFRTNLSDQPRPLEPQGAMRETVSAPVLLEGYASLLSIQVSALGSRSITNDDEYIFEMHLKGESLPQDRVETWVSDLAGADLSPRTSAMLCENRGDKKAFVTHLELASRLRAEAALLWVKIGSSLVCWEIRFDKYGTVSGFEHRPASVHWYEPPMIGAPLSRYFHSLVFDSNRGRVIMFGGLFGKRLADPLNDLNSWDGKVWQSVTTANDPSARFGASMVWDSSRQKLVLFGGCADPKGRQALGDTWEFDGSTWRQLSPKTSPPARAQAGFIYDSHRNVCVLHGGAATDEQMLADTWEFDGTDWRQLASAPKPRAFPAMAYDASRRKVVVYGGWTPDSSSDTGLFEFDGKSWSEVKPQGGVVEAHSPRMVYAPRFKTCVLLGGGGKAWLWDGNRFRSIESTGHVPTKTGAVAYDSKRGVAVMVTAGDSNECQTFELKLR